MPNFANFAPPCAPAKFGLPDPGGGRQFGWMANARLNLFGPVRNEAPRNEFSCVFGEKYRRKSWFPPFCAPFLAFRFPLDENGP